MVKKKNKKLLIIASIIVAVIGGGFVITLKINSYLKAKRNKKIETAVQEPEINAEEERKGFRTLHDSTLVGIFAADTLKRDTLKVDTLALVLKNKVPVDSVIVAKKKPKKVKVKSKQKPKKTANALSSTIEKEEKKKVPKEVVRKPVIKRPKRYKDNVKFNFVVVKEDPENNIKVSDTDIEEKEEDEVDLNTMAQGRIYGTHMLKNNEPVTMRAIEDVKLSKKKFIPSGALLYGVCKFQNNRFEIKITRAMTAKGNFPCDLIVYDSYDFQKGIFVKGANVDVQPEEGIGDAVEEVGTVIPNPIIGSGVKGVSRLVQKDVKKMKKVTLKVPDNYTIYLIANKK